MSRERTKLYKIAKNTGNVDDWNKYKTCEKLIKNLVKKSKRRAVRAITARSCAEHREGCMKAASRILKQAPELQRTGIHPELDKAAFTKYMQTLTAAIRRAKPGKAVGTDELFVEAFSIEPQLVASALIKMWSKCNESNYIINDWRRGTLVPLFKKGNPSNPASFRPITLLSHARKVLEAALAIEIGSVYKFSASQVGFREGTRTETAIVRHTACAKRLPITAVLDLKAVYDKVPKQKLMQELRKALPPPLVKMATMSLQPLQVRTKEDHSKRWATISEGSHMGPLSLSPTLFNLYMDSYPTWTAEKVPQPKTQDLANKVWDVCLFADDVKIQTHSSGIMKNLLRASDDWANTYGMKWAPTKCRIIMETTASQEKPIFVLENEEIPVTKSATYLGVTATPHGVTDDATKQRLKQAMSRTHILRRHGVHEGNYTSKEMVHICKALIYSLVLYRLHLTPLSEETKQKWTKMEEYILRMALGTYSKHKHGQLMKIAGLLPLKEHLGRFMDSLTRRVGDRAGRDKNNARANQDVRELEQLKQALRSPSGR